MTWFLHCVPNWLLSRPFDIILSLCTQMTHFKTIWTDFCIVYPIDSFQDHLTWFLHCVPNWLLSRPFAQILSLCTQLTPFKTIWLNSRPTYFFTYSRPFELIVSFTICPSLIIVYPIDSFQDHMTQFYHYVPHWLLSRPYDLILSLYTHLTPFKTIWPIFCVVYPVDSFQDHLPQVYHCVPYWLLSRPFDLIFVLYTKLIPFRTISPNFIIVYPIDSFQDNMT